MKIRTVILKKTINYIAAFFPISKHIAHAEEVRAALSLPGKGVYELPANQLAPPQAVESAFDELREKQLELPARHLFLLKNVNVSSHGVVFKNLSIFIPSLVYHTLLSEYQGTLLLKQWIGRLPHVPDSRPFALIYDHWGSINYFHWVVESLPRLLVLLQQQPNCRLILPSPLPGFVQETLTLFGCHDYLMLEAGQVVEAKELWFVDHLSNYWLHDVAILHKLRATIWALYNLPKIKPSRKVYVSRNRAKYRKITNDYEVMELVQKYSFEVYFFEDLSFEAQVKLMYETQVLIGIHGASLTNLLFMQPGANLVELINQEYANLAFFKLAVPCKIQYQYLPCANASEQADNNANIRVDTNELMTLLDALTLS